MMRFSIRTLLGVTFVVAVGLLAWRMAQDVEEAEARIEVIKAEIKPLEARVRLDDPALHQVILNTRDQYDSLFAMRDRAVEHFDVLRDKYSAVEPRGDDVLSLRTLPSLQTDGGHKPVVLRLWVPETRTIWLKCGVHPVDRSVSSSRPPDEESDLVRASPFEHSGPFEMKLPPGDHLLTIHTGATDNGSLPMSLSFDSEVLLKTAFVAPDVTGSSSSHISGAVQTDYSRRQPLPWLLTANMNLDNNNSSKTSFGFSVWLSDHSSEFAAFPRADVSSEGARGE